MISGKPLELHLGPADMDGTPLTYTLVSGRGSVEMIYDAEWGQNIYVYRWTPSEADAEKEYQVTVKLDGGSVIGTITSMFTIKADRFPIANYDGDIFYVMVGDKPFELYLGPPEMGETFKLESGPGSIETIDHPEWGKQIVYRWVPVADDAGKDQKVTITMSGGELVMPISGTFTVIAEKPHFPVQDLNGQFFGAMISGKPLELHLGPADMDGTPLTYTLVSGPGSVEMIYDAEWGQNIYVYRWTPSEADAEKEYQVTVKLDGGSVIGTITSTFTVRVDRFPLLNYAGEIFRPMIGGEPFELHLGSIYIGETPTTYTLVSGPGNIVTVTDPEWGNEMAVYRWAPVNADAGIEYQVTITMSGGEVVEPISGKFTLIAEKPHSPLEDYAGQTFYASPKHPLDLYLGDISFNETPITFTLLNGPGNIVQDVDKYSTEPEQAWFYRWTPTEAEVDFDISFQVSITMNGGPLDGFTANFTVQGFKDFSVDDLVSYFPDTMHVQVGEMFEFFLGPLIMDETQINYSLTGPGELINKSDPLDASMFSKVYIWTPTDADIGIPKKVTINVDGGEFGTASGSFYVVAEKPFSVYDIISHYPETMHVPAGEMFEFFLGPLEIDKTQIKYSLTGPGELTTKIDPWDPSMIMQVYIWIPTDADIGIPKMVTINIDGGRFGTASGYFYVVAEKPFSVEELLSDFPETEYVRAGEKIEGILGPIEFDETQINYSLTGPGELITMPDPWDPNMIVQVYIWTPTEADIGIPIKVTITIDAGKFGYGSRTVNIVVEKAFSVDEIFSYFPDTLYAPVGREAKLFLGPTLMDDVPITYILTSGPGYIVDEYDPKDPEFTEKVFRWMPTDADIGIPKKVTITINGGKYGTASGSVYLLAEKSFSVDKILSHIPDTLYALVGMESKLFLGPTFVDNMPITYILTSGLGYLVDEPDPKYPGSTVKVFRWTPTDANINNPQPVMITVSGGVFGSGYRTFFAVAFIEAALEYFLPRPGELIIEHFDDFLIFLGPVELKEKILTYTIVEGPPGGEILKMSEPKGIIAVYHWNPSIADINMERTLTLRVTDGEKIVESTFRIMTGDTPPMITNFPKDTTIEAGQSYTDYLMVTDETPENITYYLISPPLG
ncbi:MAG TPA: hypothetical protein ENH82_00315, partial [bacterium]|nr:hypothetical protein [bacterium]